MTTRARKLEYIRSFGPYALEKAVEDMLHRKEAGWLTDEQIDDITEKMVSDARFKQHLNMENRSARRDAAMTSVQPTMFRPRPGLNAATGELV